jgi:hypothetical protein
MVARAIERKLEFQALPATNSHYILQPTRMKFKQKSGEVSVLSHCFVRSFQTYLSLSPPSPSRFWSQARKAV